MRFQTAVWLALFISAALSSASAAVTTAPHSSFEAAHLISAIDANLNVSGEWVRPPGTKLASGDYSLCVLKPDIIYRNMVGGAAASSREVPIIYRGWKEYIRAIATALDNSRTTPNLSNLALRAKLDRDIRVKIGEFGITEPGSAAMKHYHALLWSSSCLIDRLTRTSCEATSERKVAIRR